MLSRNRDREGDLDARTNSPHKVVHEMDFQVDVALDRVSDHEEVLTTRSSSLHLISGSKIMYAQNA